jgi:hypothetical protein
MSLHIYSGASGPWFDQDDYERRAVMDDREIVTEADVEDSVSVVVECEWGYEGCQRSGVVAEMKRHDDGWMCWHCYRTAEAEAQDYDRMRAGY